MQDHAFIVAQASTPEAAPLHGPDPLLQAHPRRGASPQIHKKAARPGAWLAGTGCGRPGRPGSERDVAPAVQAPLPTIKYSKSWTDARWWPKRNWSLSKRLRDLTKTSFDARRSIQG